MKYLAIETHGQSPLNIIAFALLGLFALGFGLIWAFDVRGITTSWSEHLWRKHEERRARTLGRLGGSPIIFRGTPGRLRLRGAVSAVAGLVLLVAAYAMWHLG